MPSIAEGAQRWRRLVLWLDRYFEKTVWGLRVYELHQTHGLHLHALFNRYARVEFVRHAAESVGFGRIQKQGSTHSLVHTPGGGLVGGQGKAVEARGAPLV